MTRRQDSPFFLATGLLLLGLVVIGFSRTFYLRGVFGAPELTLVLHLHGAAMTAWFGLFVAQAWWIATRRPAVHRTLGWVGLGLAVAVAVLGTVVSVHKVLRDLAEDPGDVGSVVLFSLQLLIVVLFLLFVGLGVLDRRRGDWHKRWMTLAMLQVIGPALTRLPLGRFYEHNVPLATAAFFLVLLLCVGADWARTRRLHPAFAIGSAVTVAGLVAVSLVAQTNAWQDLVKAFLGLADTPPGMPMAGQEPGGL